MLGCHCWPFHLLHTSEFLPYCRLLCQLVILVIGNKAWSWQQKEEKGLGMAGRAGIARQTLLQEIVFMTLWSRKTSSHHREFPAEALPGTEPTQQGFKSLPPPGTGPTQLKEAIPGCFIEHLPALGLNTQLHADLWYFESTKNTNSLLQEENLTGKIRKAFTIKPNGKENWHIHTI